MAKRFSWKEERKGRRMLKKGKRFARFLPEGYRLLGVDPGYLFVTNDSRHSLDLTEEIVDHLMPILEESLG